MKLLSVFEKINNPTALALGFFDCIHRGHRELLTKTINIAKSREASAAVFTFNNNPFSYLGKDTKLIYTFDERLDILTETGIDTIIFANFNETFKNITHIDFLNALKNNFNLIGLICGYDHKIGKDGAGNTECIQKFCIDKNIRVELVKDYILNGIKVSSSIIRQLLMNGDIEQANLFLGASFFAVGKIISGRGEGSKLGFPTANFKWNEDKIMPKEGVYATITTINGENYKSVTNLGSKPTFNDFSVSAETFLKDFNGNLYGKNIKLHFKKRLRDVVRFESVDLLKEQIYKDINQA